MVTRIRIEAEGPSIADVERQLTAAAERIAYPRPDIAAAITGDHIIARDRNEPKGDTAFKGRIVVHPPSDWLR